VRCLITGQSAFGASAQNNVAVPSAAQPGALPGGSQNGTYPNGLTTYGDFNNAYNNDYNVNYTYYPNPPPDYSIAYGAINNSCMTIPGVERYP
jgi:hypothetical protein